MAAAAWKTRPATVATSTRRRLPADGSHGGRRGQLAAGIQEPAQQKRRNPVIAFNHAKQPVSRDRIFGRLLFLERADADAIRICGVEAFDIIRRPSHGLRLENLCWATNSVEAEVVLGQFQVAKLVKQLRRPRGDDRTAPAGLAPGESSGYRLPARNRVRPASSTSWISSGGSP